MEIEPLPLSARRAGFDENDSEDGARRHQQPSRAGKKASIPQQADQRWNEKNRRDYSGQRVQKHHGGIEDIGLRERVEIRG